MNKRKIKYFILYGLLLLVLVGNVSGCGESEKELLVDTESINSESDKEISGGEIIEMKSSDVSSSEADIEEKTETEFSEEIFHRGAEKYFALIEGEWVVVEYAGIIRASHSDETRENWEEYEEQSKKYTDKIIEKYMGSEYRVETDNLVSLEFYDTLDGVIEDDDTLFNITRFIPGEFIDITPPYIGLYVCLADKEEGCPFIIDANGVVLIEVDYRFFRLERKSYENS